MIQKTITMTSKGTFTLPAVIRKELGLNAIGDKLLLNYHPKSHKITIEKPANLYELQARNAALIKARGIKPLSTEALRKLREERHEDYRQTHFD